MPFFLCSFLVPETGKELDADPRGLMGQVVRGAGDKGYKCMSGAEFEVGMVDIVSLADVLVLSIQGNTSIGC